ncbi:MAG: MotA/TolQ/ExbB proton channel family protein [Pseudomonadales bacterium]|nr:MotA/TolQ/ExbB proton channel family protein [Pseudomonadales bacterium]
MNWLDWQYNIQQFLEAGGVALWLIAVSMFLLWVIVIERYLFLYQLYPKLRAHWLGHWQIRNDKRSWKARRIRELMISEAKINLNVGLPLLKVLVVMCPLMGLLGTVIGMIEVFDTMAMLGTGNARAMASGISRATIPTMAGMVVALPGMYFHSQLQQRANRETARLVDQLTY